MYFYELPILSVQQDPNSNKRILPWTHKLPLRLLYEPKTFLTWGLPLWTPYQLLYFPSPPQGNYIGFPHLLTQISIWCNCVNLLHKFIKICGLLCHIFSLWMRHIQHHLKQTSQRNCSFPGLTMWFCISRSGKDQQPLTENLRKH